MFRKKLRESLADRIFLLTFCMLLGAGAMTFGFIAWATPLTYDQVITEELKEQAQELSKQIENKSYQEMLDLMAKFVWQTGAEVQLTGQDGIVKIDRSGIITHVVAVGELSAKSSIAVVQDTKDSNVEVVESSDVVTVGELSTTSIAVVEDTEDIYAAAATESTKTSKDLTTIYGLEINGLDGDYVLSVATGSRPVNQSIQALKKVATWLLGALLLISAVCAYGYSRYIAHPILNLSAIAKKMAGLDFEWEYTGGRSDEIGALGHSLNKLSKELSSSLAELRTANAALQRDIDRERELESQRMAFFSAVSHELKTPVTILKGQLTGMLEGVDIYRDRDKYLSRALQVTGRMEHLVQEILTVSRMESFGFVPQEELLDLSHLIQVQLPLHMEWMEQTGIQLETHLPPTAPVRGDEKLLGKALGNILSNAVLYSPRGAIVTVTVEQQAKEVLCIVENSGVKIPEEAFPRLFDAFYRVEQSRSRSTGGSGLGLYLTGLILQHHHARYDIKNTAQGVCFTIHFSAKNRGAAQENAAPIPC